MSVNASGSQQRNGSLSASGNDRGATGEWRTYRKLIKNNYANHRDAYDQLHSVVAAQAPEGYRFFDIACGDAGLTSQALQGTPAGQYYGTDISKSVLYFAARSLRALPCPWELVQGDLLDVLQGWQRPVDIAWIGLSLHHFTPAQKLRIMAEIRRIVAPNGLFLFYENTSPDGEDRDGWLERWDAQRADWTELSDDEWTALNGHVHSHDFPETDSYWRQLGREARFSETSTLFVSPADLFRMYCFRA